jgi:hypothetical protein
MRVGGRDRRRRAGDHPAVAHPDRVGRTLWPRSYGYAPQRSDADERDSADDRRVYPAPAGQEAAPPARYAQTYAPQAYSSQAYSSQAYGYQTYPQRPYAAQSYTSPAASPAYGARYYAPPQGAYADSRYAPPPSDDSRVRYQDANNGQAPSADDRYADPHGPY